MKCPKCYYENKSGRKFCSQCGSKLGCKCSNCGTINIQKIRKAQQRYSIILE